MALFVVGAEEEWIPVSAKCRRRRARIRRVSAEDVDAIGFAWEHDRKLVRAVLEDRG
jgi:hypothetical protein